LNSNAGRVSGLDIAAGSRTALYIHLAITSSTSLLISFCVEIDCTSPELYAVAASNTSPMKIHCQIQCNATRFLNATVAAVTAPRQAEGNPNVALVVARA